MSQFSRIVGVGLTGASLLGGNAKAVLIPESIGMPVQFSYNPKSVTLEKSTKTESNRATVDSPSKDAVKASGNVRMKLRGAHLTGAVVTQAAIDQLLSWATPTRSLGVLGTVANMAYAARGALDAAVGVGRSVLPRELGGSGSMPSQASTRMPGLSALGGTGSELKLPVLLLMWGVGGPLGSGTKVNLEKVDVEYKRFDWTGVPVWAEVTLSLVEYTAPLPRQNPTSGGVTGHRRHTVVAGDGLVQIATRAYGTPHAWRAVAEANGLDDPLRVRPGTRLVLPAPDELDRGERR